MFDEDDTDIDQTYTPTKNERKNFKLVCDVNNNDETDSNTDTPIKFKPKVFKQLNIKKRNLSEVFGATQEEENGPIKKYCNKVEHKVRQTRKKQIKWTPYEEKILQLQFRDNILLGKLPPQHEINIKVKKKLPNRQMEEIRQKVRRMIQAAGKS